MKSKIFWFLNVCPLTKLITCLVDTCLLWKLRATFSYLTQVPGQNVLAPEALYVQSHSVSSPKPSPPPMYLSLLIGPSFLLPLSREKHYVPPSTSYVSPTPRIQPLTALLVLGLIIPHLDNCNNLVMLS